MLDNTSTVTRTITITTMIMYTDNDKEPDQRKQLTSLL